MHLVHFSTRYATIAEADNGDDHSIAVLAVMFEVSIREKRTYVFDVFL